MTRKRENSNKSNEDKTEKIEETNGNSNRLNIDYYDSSDEEDIRNTIGNIPIQWYDEYGHVGYDLDGEKITKPAGKEQPIGQIDAFLEREEDPDYWRKVFDQQTGQNVILTDEQVEKLQSIAMSRYPEIGYNPYQPFFEIFSSKREIHPISNQPPSKSSFVPSADERRIVGRMVHAIKNGWMKKREEIEKEDEERELEEEFPKVYDIWSDEGNLEAKTKSELARLKMNWIAPKVQLPGHSESYRPPPEYLFSKQELKKWEETERERRRPNFIPRVYDAFRKVPFYERFYDERLERCMNLYLAPRQQKLRLKVDADQLLPVLPNPKDLQPFPTTLAFYMRGHKGQVRSISVEPEFGELLVSGGSDSTVRVWALPNGNCLRKYEMAAPVTCVQFCPDPKKLIVLVSCECEFVTILNISTGDRLLISQTKQFLTSLPIEEAPENTPEIKWLRYKETEKQRNDKNSKVGVQLQMKDKIRSVTWHRKGDYFATVGFQYSSSTILIHQLSKCNSQKPFTKCKGFVESVLFHPSKPLFFVGTRQHILIYDLARNELKRKLFPGTRWLSCMVLHPEGNNLFIGGLDRTFSWMDLELGTKPWKKLRTHQLGIRSITYHKRYPLLATVSDDATAIVYHARASQDLAKDNDLVPVKRLFGHKVLAKRELSKLKEQETEINENKKDDDKEKKANKPHDENSGSEEELPRAKLDNTRLSILCATFHPIQPWLITSGADGQIALFTY
ncbi:hypothetical protein ACQ4LE_006490 [Meloidogyne hapla]|uniref:Ribosome biogenesis protein BOP1 homolog n=1 Tax=Meloidogyne hapla TaxID=6305 RepID=A0A1I8BY95_MELHA